MQSYTAPGLDIVRHTKGQIPDLPFLAVKNAILGRPYQLSLVFPTTTEATRLHQEYEHKPGPANILSFPYEQDSGEIIMHLETLRREAKTFAHPYRDHLLFMFIHGCAHLAGHDHGDAMEAFEKQFRKQFNLIPNE